MTSLHSIGESTTSSPKKSGQGKITVHGPHRDPWVDCPENAINVWIAVGPVLRGNGLVIFKRDYSTEFAFKNGYMEPGAKLHHPLTFDLQPGDAILFHSKHLHGSQLNWTDRTRYVVSYRITFGKPYYPHGHYHHSRGTGRWSMASVGRHSSKSPEELLPLPIPPAAIQDNWTGKMSGNDGSSAQSKSKSPAF